MNMSKLSQAQIEVVSDYLDLLQNGYVNMFAIYKPEFWFMKERHLTNGRILTFRWSSGYAALYDAKKELKRYA